MIDTGRGIPGRYAGRGMMGRGGGRVFSTRGLTRSRIILISNPAVLRSRGHRY